MSYKEATGPQARTSPTLSWLDLGFPTVYPQHAWYMHAPHLLWYTEDVDRFARYVPSDAASQVARVCTILLPRRRLLRVIQETHPLCGRSALLTEKSQ